jgi:hypothetical protein
MSKMKRALSRPGYLRVAFVGLLLAGLALVMAQAFSMEEDKEMAHMPALKSNVPPIDASAPARTETATFALG